MSISFVQVQNELKLCSFAFKELYSLINKTHLALYVSLRLFMSLYVSLCLWMEHLMLRLIQSLVFYTALTYPVRMRVHHRCVVTCAVHMCQGAAG